MGKKTISTTTQILEREIEKLEDSILFCKELKQPLVDRVNKIDESLEIYRMQLATLKEDLDRLYPPY